MPHRRVVRIHTGSIALGALLKWAGVAGSGGEAKALIAARRVLVNGQVESRRGRRVAQGDVVAIQGGPTIEVAGSDDGASSAAVAS